jgi:hypothetical protein
MDQIHRNFDRLVDTVPISIFCPILDNGWTGRYLAAFETYSMLFWHSLGCQVLWLLLWFRTVVTRWLLLPVAKSGVSFSVWIRNRLSPLTR